MPSPPTDPAAWTVPALHARNADHLAAHASPAAAARVWADARVARGGSFRRLRDAIRQPDARTAGRLDVLRENLRRARLLYVVAVQHARACGAAGPAYLDTGLDRRPRPARARRYGRTG